MDKKAVGVTLLTAVLVACGGGGGGGGVPEPRPEGIAEGVVQHGPVADALITAYDWDGARGAIQGTARTDSDGRYSLSMSVPDRSILLGSQEGRYAEESTGRSVSMGADELTAVVFYESGRSVDVQLTYFTTLATCRAEYLIENGATVGRAISQANAEWSAILGVDIVGVQPVDVTQGSAFTPFMTPPHQYGVALAGVSELVNTLRLEEGVDDSSTAYTVKYITRVACDDVRFDGELDGIGQPTAGNPSGQLYIGATPLHREVYRLGLAQGVIAFGGNENNRTGLVASDFMEVANGISTNASVVFGGVEGQPVDSEGPVISSVINEGTLLNSNAELMFEVEDPLGVASVQFYIDGELYADGQPSSPILRWNTDVFSDGEHIVRVVATDVLNNQSEAEFGFVVVNGRPVVSMTSPTLVNSESYLAQGTYSSTRSTVARVLVDGVEAQLDPETQTWEATIALTGGINIIPVEAFDELGNSSSILERVAVDQIHPVLNSSRDMRVYFSDFSGQLNLCEFGYLNNDNNASRPICLNAERVSLDGSEVGFGLVNDDYIVIGVNIEDPQGQGVFSAISEMNLEYRVELNGEAVIDWRDIPRPDRTERTAYLPVTTEYFGDGFFRVSRSDVFSVHIRLIDEAGNQDDLTFRFTLDVLTPAFTTQTRIANRSVFSTPYDLRGLLSGEEVVVEYTWDNQSSLPYMVQVDASDDHAVVQTYQTAQRFNRARNVTSYEWRGREFLGFGSSTDTNTWEWTDYRLISSIEEGWGAFTQTFSPPETTYSEYFDLSTDMLSPQPPTQWSNIDDRHNVLMSTCTSSGMRTALANTAAAYFRKVNLDADCVKVSEVRTLQERTVYSVEYEAGYPRNQVTSSTVDHAVSDSSIRLVNETGAVEIVPQNGWYAIPSNSQITIEKTIRLPSVLNYSDARVATNGSDVPYGSQISQDTELRYTIDTGLTVTRAINAGSVDEVDQVSHTRSSHGGGTQVFVIRRP